MSYFYLVLLLLQFLVCLAWLAAMQPSMTFNNVSSNAAPVSGTLQSRSRESGTVPLGKLPYVAGSKTTNRNREARSRRGLKEV